MAGRVSSKLRLSPHSRADVSAARQVASQIGSARNVHTEQLDKRFDRACKMQPSMLITALTDTSSKARPQPCSLSG